MSGGDKPLAGKCLDFMYYFLLGTRGMRFAYADGNTETSPWLYRMGSG
jgi:hypothetical protein